MSNLYDVCNAAGGMTAYEWDRDPKRLAFILARYQFVARMLQRKKKVLEVGCSDGFGSRLVRQTVEQLVAIDIDEDAIRIARANNSAWYIVFKAMDFMKADAGKLAGAGFDAVYSLDVLEHIAEESDFLMRLHAVAPVCVLGSPSFESQSWASELSKAGHVNCKTESGMRASLAEYWSQVFLFGMNDTTLHTGFGPMCHYRFAVCVR